MKIQTYGKQNKITRLLKKIIKPKKTSWQLAGFDATRQWKKDNKHIFR